MRLDVYLAQTVKSRETARRLIKQGAVTVNGAVITKAAYDVTDEEVSYTDDTRYVSRGGLKLERALEEFGIDLNGRVCLDIGVLPEALPTVCCSMAHPSYTQWTWATISWIRLLRTMGGCALWRA